MAFIQLALSEVDVSVYNVFVGVVVLQLLFVVHRENLPSHFRFKEYCPVVFRKLRERFGINDEDYLVMTLSVDPVFCGYLSLYQSINQSINVFISGNKAHKNRKIDMHR